MDRQPNPPGGYELFWREKHHIFGVYILTLRRVEDGRLLSPDYSARFYEGKDLKHYVARDGRLVEVTLPFRRTFPESAGTYVVTDAAGNEHDEFILEWAENTENTENTEANNDDNDQHHDTL